MVAQIIFIVNENLKGLPTDRSFHAYSLHACRFICTSFRFRDRINEIRKGVESHGRNLTNPKTKHHRNGCGLHRKRSQQPAPAGRRCLRSDFRVCRRKSATSRLRRFGALPHRRGGHYPRLQAEGEVHRPRRWPHLAGRQSQ